MKMMYGLSGETYYIDRKMTEEEAYSHLKRFISEYCRHKKLKFNLRLLNEKYIPNLSSRIKAPKDDYYSIFLCALETAAEEAAIDPFQFMTEQELMKKLFKVYDPAFGNIPRSFLRALPSFPKR